MDFDFDLEQIIPVNSTTLTINSTGSLTVPIGTTGEQPGSPVNGMIRYNSTTDKFEGREAGAWTDIIGGGGGGLDNVVEDTTPQLGGNLDVNGFEINNAGTGNLRLDTTGTDNDIEITAGAANADIQLTAGSAGEIELTANQIRFDGPLVSFPVGSNNDLSLTPDGTGNLVLDGLNWPQADGSDGQILETDGAGQLSFVTPGSGGAATDLAAVQARRTTAYTLTTAFVDITLDTTDEETDAAIVEHNNTNTDDIDIKEDGTYLIRYESDTETAAATNNTNIQMEARVRVNDTAVLPGSEAMCASFEDNSVAGSEGPQHLSNAFIATLAANDKVTLQLSKVELSGSTVYTAERISFQVIKLEGANGNTGPTGPPGTSGSLLFYGDQLEDTDNADWAVNATALEVADSANAALIVRRFDDTTEEGVGFSIAPPAGTTSLKFTFVARAQTAPGAARTVGLKLYNRGIPDNAAVESWNAGTILADIDIPTNAFFQYDTETITLSTLGMTVGEDTQLQLTRIDPVAGTELTGDWNLRALQVEFV